MAWARTTACQGAAQVLQLRKRSQGLQQWKRILKMWAAEAARSLPAMALERILSPSDLRLHLRRAKVPEFAMRVEHGVVRMGLRMIADLVPGHGGCTVGRRVLFDPRANTEERTACLKPLHKLHQSRQGIGIGLIVQIEGERELRRPGRRSRNRARDVTP